MAYFSALLRLLRPHQWIKNGFVFVGVLFGHVFGNTALLYHAALAAGFFCLISSAVYIYNDLMDYPQDRLHPVKKNRPIASQTISVPVAIILCLTLLFTAILGGYLISPKVAFILISYFILNIAYTHYLKHIVILDVFAISAGFMLRILAGTVGIGILASQWLMFCGLMITLFLGFAKRRAESIAISEDMHGMTRRVLKQYQNVFLDKMISITASCSVVGYGLYTMSPVTMQIHHTQNLIYTLPFVLYGIFRYLYLLHTATRAGQDTAKDLFGDVHLLITLFLWLIATLWLID